MPRNRTPILLTAASLALLTAGSLCAAQPSSADRFDPLDAPNWQASGSHPAVELKGGEPAIAIFTVPADGAGFYAVTDSRIRRDTAIAGRIELRLQVTHADTPPERQPGPAVTTTLAAGELFDFDAFLGYLAAGDTVRITVGPTDDGPVGDRAEIDCRIVRVPSIPVSVFPDDVRDATAVRAPGGWSLIGDVDAISPAVRRLGWRGSAGTAFTLSTHSAQVTPGRTGHEAVAAFRVPHSGYYALHDAWFTGQGSDTGARIFVGDELWISLSRPQSPADKTDP